MPTKMSSDESLLKSPVYHKIKSVVDALMSGSNGNEFSGNCIAASDILQTVLSKAGIACKILECQVSIVVEEGSGNKRYHFIGYDNYSYPGQIDTHTVVLTEADDPILIDISLGYILSTEQPVVIERIKRNEKEISSDGTIGEFKVGNATLSYSEKKNIRLAGFHQKNLLQRILKEQDIDKNMNKLKLFIICAVSLGVINFSLNAILIILRLLNITLV